MRTAAVLVLPALLVAGLLPLALAEEEEEFDPWLTVAQDESSVELKIRDFLVEEYELPVSTHRLDAERDDIVLSVRLEGPEEGSPSLTFSIDTEPSAHDEERVVERVIVIHAYHALPDGGKTPELRARILELNNTFAAEFWMPHRFYLDEDGDVAMESLLNIPGPEVKVHAEMVCNLLGHMHLTWEEYLPKLEKILGE
jgi:hypothetical protein